MSCIQCAIPAPFYEKGYVIIRSSHLQSLGLNSSFFIDEGTVALRYDSLQAAQTEVNRLVQFGAEDLQVGLARKPRIERMLDATSMLARLEERETIEFIKDGELTSYMQPIVAAQTKEVHGYEALLRAKSQTEALSPARLFDIALRTGLHNLLDQRARESAVLSRKGKIGAGTKSFINFLPSTIYNPDFCLRHTFAVVEKHGVDPHDLVFEVVETEKIIDIPHLKKVLAKYQQEGMKVALDDVGAGFSTLEVLAVLQPDYVKIDRSYVSGCHEDVKKQKFLMEVNSRAKALGILTVAEGMENEQEYEVCTEIGYDFCQGFYIGKPQMEPAVL